MKDWVEINEMQTKRIIQTINGTKIPLVSSLRRHTRLTSYGKKEKTKLMKLDMEKWVLQ
jgi:hypothetical protein